MMNGKSNDHYNEEQWKVAAVLSHENHHPRVKEEQDTANALLMTMKKVVEDCYKEEIKIIVFPAYTGAVTEDHMQFLDGVMEISRIFPTVAICPGSFIEWEGGNKYHSSCIVKNGCVILKQRQLYRANWEIAAGFSQGTDVEIADLFGKKVGIVLSTDAFFPQVSRYMTLEGVELVLSPMAILKESFRSVSSSYFPIWTNVQANMFFAVESGVKGVFQGQSFYSQSAIHAPLAMTENGDGFLQVEEVVNLDQLYMIATLDFRLRSLCLQHSFNPLKHLHPQIYSSIFAGGKGE